MAEHCSGAVARIERLVCRAGVDSIHERTQPAGEAIACGRGGAQASRPS